MRVTAKGMGAGIPAETLVPLMGSGGGAVRGKVLTGKEGDFCYLKFLLCT